MNRTIQTTERASVADRRRRSLITLTVLWAAGLAACGGGSGSSSSTVTGGTAPTITAQPQSQSVTVGATATFSVGATGSAPLSFQWSENGTAISGATGANYTTPATVSGDNGAAFTVQVSNSAGSMTSSAATLTVTGGAPVAPTITTQPQNQNVTAGVTATFSVVATGTAPLSYQWSKNGTAISGATNASYVTPPTMSGDSGSTFTVQVSNAAGSQMSSAATLTVTTAAVAPTITTQPLSQTVTVGGMATFTVVATGTAPLSYQWLKNTVAIAGATNPSYTTPAAVSGDSGSSFTVNVSNVAGSQTSNAATLTVNVPPAITTQPQSQTVALGAMATFSVMATGTAPLSYQWSKNNVAISGASNSSYTTPATVSGDSGSTFSVKVSNVAGSQTSNAATLTVTTPVAPTITTQPLSQTVTAGATATFSVVATGTAPLSYQWSKNNVAISGATNSSYTTPATVSGDSGSTFSVKVSNVAGSQTSNAATLTVNPASGAGTPQIIQHWSTATSPAASGNPTGNAYQINIAPTGSGDVVVLGFTGVSGQTPTVTDSAGDAIPGAICSADNGGSNGLSYLYAIASSAGVTWFKVNWSGSGVVAFNFVLTEFNNIPTVTAQGHNCQAGLTAVSGTVTPNGFTPANNDASGGNLIYNYTALATGNNTPNCNASGYTAASGFVRFGGDTSNWLNGNGYGFQSVIQTEVQATAASVTASVAMAGETCSGGSGDQFNSLTAALKIGSAGISYPTGIHVVQAQQLTTDNFNTQSLPSSFSIPFSSIGNLRVFMFDASNGNGSWDVANGTVTSSDGCNFTETLGSNSGLYFYYAENCSPCSNCTISFPLHAGTALANTAGKFYDVINAQASSFLNYTDANLTCSTGSIAADPSITPAAAPGLVLTVVAVGNGPVSKLTAPAGAVYAVPNFTGISDGEHLAYGDAHGFNNYSSTSAQSWTWTVTGPGNTCSGLAAAFK